MRQPAVRIITQCALVAMAGMSCVRPMQTFAAGYTGPMSREQRVLLFDAVWKHVADRYYEASYHGADWREVRRRYAPLVDSVRNDDDMHKLLVRMVGELRDAHSRYLPPADAAALRTRITRGIGATVAEVEGVPVIESVVRNSPADRAGFEPGMRILAVDGESIQARYQRLLELEPSSSTERATRALVWRSTILGRDSLLSVTVEHDGESRELAATRRAASSTPRLAVRMLPDSVLYLRFDGFRVPVANELRDSMRAHPNAHGIVVDLRNNGGGDAAETIRAAGLFLSKRVSAGEFFSRVPNVRMGFVHTRDRSRPRTGGSSDAETRPLVILTSVLSGSGAELMSAILQEERRATIVGDTTCGCLTAVTRRESMPGGGMLMISNRGYRTGRGVVIEGQGVAPDMVVRQSRADLVARRDPALDAARALLSAYPPHASRALQ